MKFIFDIIKGIFIGVANIIPGVSGGTMAVSMGVYDKLIGSINNLTKEFKKSFITLLPIAIGMIGGIGIFSFIIPYCLTNYSFQTCMCFVGLIMGGIPAIFVNMQNSLDREQKKINPLHIISFLVFLGIAVFMAIANPTSATADSITINPLMIILLIVMGAICAAAMVIPGISGSLLLMMLGYYSGIIGTISSFLSALKNMDGSALVHCILVLVPFAVGCILGVLLISKLITWLLKRFESITYCGILGLIAASPFAILYKMENPSYTPVSVAIGIVLFIVSALFTYFFGRETKKVK
ncbi:MAG: DUF368 domain-containing protein [Butyrivibrio sp.]